MDADSVPRWRWGLMIVLLCVSALCFWMAILALSNDRLWVAAALGVATFVCVGLAGPGGEEEEAPRWGTAGERWSMSGDDFERLVREVEIRGTAPTAGEIHDDDFAAVVSQALDELPDWIRAELDRGVSVLVGDDGERPERYWAPQHGSIYGLYHPSETGPDWRTGARIVIFRDTLVRDFGHDEDELRRQIVQTVRHEVAHHFGADERRVEELGL